MTNTRNTPIEALERAFPMRVRAASGCGGGAAARVGTPGGEGIERDLEVLEDVTVSLITERRVSQPWGLAGGEPGRGGRELAAARRRRDAGPSGCPTSARSACEAGDVLRMLTPGGGGWGRPPGPVEGSDGARWLGRGRCSRSSTTTSRGRRGSRSSGRGSRRRSVPVARRIEHVGSTSVPGLAAKPIVDISVGVDDPDDDAAFVPALIGAGYSLRVIEPEHRMFRSPQRDVHVHVWREGSDKQREQLVFRDWLRVNDGGPVAATSRSSVTSPHAKWESMGDYADAKTDVVAEIMRRASG